MLKLNRVDILSFKIAMEFFFVDVKLDFYSKVGL